MRTLAETVNGSETREPLRITITGANHTPNPHLFAYEPWEGGFTTDEQASFCKQSDMWNGMTYVEKGNYILEKYKVLTRLHMNQNNPEDQKFNFLPRLMVCKTFKESTFNTQIKAGGSSAVGLSQVLGGTLEDLVSRFGFRSKLTGYTRFDRASDFEEWMATDPMLQMEVGMAVLEMKRVDNRLSGANIQPILEAYYGSDDPAVNTQYAEDIMACSRCIGDSEVITQSCLCKTKPNDANCLTTLKSGGCPR